MNKKGIFSVGVGAAALTYGIIKLIKGNKPEDIEVEAVECCEDEESDCEEEESEE